MTTSTDRRRPLGPGFTHAGLALALILVVAALALRAIQPPPPTIAEFAPQAMDQITDAPSEQAAGRGPRGRSPDPEVEGPASATPTPRPRDVIEVPRVHRCIGDPPRQTEDPQSPPCVPYWDPKADNGGATSKGVTANEIRVAYPRSLERPEDIQRLRDHFNSRYEFYGRRITLQMFGPRGASEPPAMQADAEKVAIELDAFASLAYPPRGGSEHHYYDRLASRGVVGVDSHATLRSEADLSRHRPYQWSVLPTYDRMMRQYGEWICKAMAGRPARHADASIAGRPRVFALLRGRAPDGTSPDVTSLRAQMASCDAKPAHDEELSGRTLQEGQGHVIEMVRKEVTSVICICSASHLGEQLMPAAMSQGYGPEWLVQTFQYQDYDSAGQSWPASQASRALGVTFRNRWSAPSDMPWYWAIREVDPTWATPPGEQGWYTALYERYMEMLVVASGIQLAGPNLTPETFEQGLFRARFPNPGAGGPPHYQARVGFGQGDHSFFDDGVMIWWSNSERGHSANRDVGTYCYVRQGVRYQQGSWPREDPPFFQGPCR